MQWTRELQVRYLVQLPWTLSVTRDAEGGYLAEVSELPFLLASGIDEKDAARDLYAGLWSVLEAMLEHGDAIPIPPNSYCPWERGEAPVLPPTLRLVDGTLAGDAWTPTSSSVTHSMAVGV